VLQGGLRTPPAAEYRHDVIARNDGVLQSIDKRRLATLAKLAGAPVAAAAGVELHARLGQLVLEGMPVMKLHAESPGELAYALECLGSHSELLRIREMLPEAMTW